MQCFLSKFCKNNISNRVKLKTLSKWSFTALAVTNMYTAEKQKNIYNDWWLFLFMGVCFGEEKKHKTLEHSAILHLSLDSLGQASKYQATDENKRQTSCKNNKEVVLGRGSDHESSKVTK